MSALSQGTARHLSQSTLRALDMSVWTVPACLFTLLFCKHNQFYLQCLLYRWDVLVEILGAQKQRISRLGVELKHEKGAGNKLSKGT